MKMPPFMYYPLKAESLVGIGGCYSLASCSPQREEF
jgi:hypothetical protein